MKAFDLIIGINGKSYITQVVAVYMWEATFDSRNYAKGTAIAIVLLLMIAIVVVPYLRYNNKQQAYR
jgi:glucose/mannose transport system permease protein